MITPSKTYPNRPQTLIDRDQETSLAAAITEFKNVERERDALTRKLVSISRHMRTLARLTELNEQRQRLLMNLDELIWPPHGATDAVRFALRYSGECMTGLQIKNFLEEKGFDWHRFSNPAAVIRSTVLSMIKRDEASRIEQPDGTTTFRYVPKAKRTT